MNWKKQDTVWLSDILERDHWIEHRSATIRLVRGCDRIIKSDTVPITDRSIYWKKVDIILKTKERTIVAVARLFPIKIIETPLFNFILKLKPTKNIHDVNFKIAAKK